MITEIDTANVARSLFAGKSRASRLFDIHFPYMKKD